MKHSKIILIIFLFLLAFTCLNAEEAKVTFNKTGRKVEFTIKQDFTVKAVADSINMPVKKLKAMLGSELSKYGEDNPEYAKYKSQNRKWDELTLSELDIAPTLVAEKFEKFTKETLSFGYSVTWVGILVVFFSLLLISVLINQFQHIEKTKELKIKKKPATKTVASPVGNITGPESAISSNAIVAVIAALHKHKLSVEERVKIQMTFSRTPVNMWSASAKMDMPNRVYNKPIDGSKR